MQTWLLRLGVYLLRKPNFKKWTILEDKKYDVIKAVEKATLDLPRLLLEYISTALILHPKRYDKVFWKDTLAAFVKIHSVTVPDTNLPLISKHSETKESKDPWDYSGRLWFFYSDILARAYGWSAKQIASLRTEDALAYIQEIMTNEYLERDFQHSLSEMAYSYDKLSKKSKLVPLPKPYWMLPDVKEKKKAPAIPKSLIPVGNVINLIDETKKIKSE